MKKQLLKMDKGAFAGKQEDYDLIKEANIICNNCDVRPIIIDSNPEGIVFICESSCNEIVGKLFNKLVTTELDITC